MVKRILVAGAAVIVLTSTVVVNLAILDVVEISTLKESLGQLISVTAVTTGAIALIFGLAKFAMKE